MTRGEHTIGNGLVPKESSFKDEAETFDKNTASFFRYNQVSKRVVNGGIALNN